MGKRALLATAARQMRAIARCPAHLTHVLNEQVQPNDFRGMQFVREQLEYVLSRLGPSESSHQKQEQPTKAPDTEQC